MNATGQNQKHEVPLAERFSVSPEEASALTGIGITSVREAISAGDLKAKKHGRKVVVLPDEIKAWLRNLPDAASTNADA